MSATLKDLYNALKKDGRFTEPKDFNTFAQKMNERGYSNMVYNTVRNAGANVPDIATFRKNLGVHVWKQGEGKTNVRVKQPTSVVGREAQKVEQQRWGTEPAEKEPQQNSVPDSIREPQQNSVPTDTIRKPQQKPAKWMLPDSIRRIGTGTVKREVEPRKWDKENSSALVKGLQEYRDRQDFGHRYISYVDEKGKLNHNVLRDIMYAERGPMSEHLEEVYRAGEDYANEEYDRMTSPAFADKRNRGKDRHIVKTVEQVEKELNRSANLLVNDRSVSNYLSDAIFGEFKRVDERAQKISSAAAAGSPNPVTSDIIRGKTMNMFKDPDKLLKSLSEKATKAFGNLFSSPEMLAEIKDGARKAGVSEEYYIQHALMPKFQERVYQEFDRAQLDRYLPKGKFEYVLSGITDSISGNMFQLATMTRSQREYKQRALAMTNEGLNPNMAKPGMWDNATRGALGFIADAPLFKFMNPVGARVGSWAFGNAIAQSARIANMGTKGRMAYMAANGALSQGTVGFMYGAMNSMVQNFSTGDDTSIANTLLEGLKGGTSESASWATMGGFGGLVGGRLYRAGMGGTKGFWRGAAERVGADITKLGAEGLGMHLGGNVASMVRGDDTNWFSAEGLLEDCANVVALKLMHVPANLAKNGRQKLSNGKKESYSDYVMRNLTTYFASDEAKNSRWKFTEDEKQELFGADYTPGRKFSMKSGKEGDEEYGLEGLVHWALRTKNKKPTDRDEAYDGTDTAIKSVYDRIMSDENISWDTKAKYNALVMGTAPKDRPIMDYFRVTKYVYDYVVEEYSNKGELLSRTSYDTAEERDMAAYKLVLNKEKNRVDNARSCLIYQAMADEDLRKEYMRSLGYDFENPENPENKAIEERMEAAQKEYAEGKATESNIYYGWVNFAANRSIVRKIGEQLCEERGVDAKYFFEELIHKDPLEYTEAEREMMFEFRRRMEKKLYPEDKVHEEQSQLDGKDVAEENDLGSESPNNEAVKATLKELSDAEQGLREAMEKNSLLKDEYDRLKAEGLTNAQIFQELINRGLTREQLEPLARYINANAKVQGMVDGTQQRIEKNVGERVADWSHRGSLNGESSDGKQMVYVRDGNGRLLIVAAGDMAFDEEGHPKEGVGDMLTVYDVETNEIDFVSVRDVTFDHTESAEDYANAYRTFLQERNSEAYADAAGQGGEPQSEEPSQPLMPQEDGKPDEPQGGEIPPTPREGGDKPKGGEPPVPPTPPVGGGTSLPENGPTFKDGTPVPMTVDSKGRPMGDLTKMTPLQGAEYIESTLGEHAAAYIDSKIAEAEKALKKAEKGKVDMSGDMNDVQEALAQKEEEVKKAKAVLDMYNGIKAGLAELHKLDDTQGGGSTDLTGRYDKERQQGYRIGEGGVRYDRQKSEDQTGVYGRESTVQFTPKVSVKGRMKVVEVSSVQPSHRNGQWNPWHFGHDWQPKDRTSASSALGQHQALENFNPELITGDGNAYLSSSPSVNERHEVIQGNNRAEMLRRLYAEYPEKAAEYKQWLIDHAEEFGLDAEEIKKMDRPILVNELPVDDAKAKELGQYSASDLESGGKQIPTESVVINKLGDRMTNFANILLSAGELGEDATLNDLIAKNAGRVLEYLSKQGIISDTECETLLKDKTALRHWLNNVLRAGLFEGDRQTEAAFNKLPENAKKAVLATYLRDAKSPKEASIKQNLQRSFEAFAELMNIPEFANAKNLKEAREVVATEIAKGNESLFGEKSLRERYSTFELELAAMYKGLKGQKALAELLDKYFDVVQGDKATNRQLQIGEEPREPISKEEAIKEVFGSYDTIPAETQKQVDEAVKSVAVEISKEVGDDFVVTDESEADKALNAAANGESELKFSKREEPAPKERKEFRTKDGEVYGFTDGKRIYLDTKKMKPETPLHEYTHVWTEALRRVNPEEWKHVKKLLDGVEGLKEEVKKLYPELKGDDLYDEMLSVFSGREGAKKLEDVCRKLAATDGKTVSESAKAQGFIERVREALQKFWKATADMLHIKFTTAEDVADKVLADWAKGVNPNKIKEAKKSEFEQFMEDAPETENIKKSDRSAMQKFSDKALSLQSAETKDYPTYNAQKTTVEIKAGNLFWSEKDWFSWDKYGNSIAFHDKENGCSYELSACRNARGYLTSVFVTKYHDFKDGADSKDVDPRKIRKEASVPTDPVKGMEKAAEEYRQEQLKRGGQQREQTERGVLAVINPIVNTFKKDPRKAREDLKTLIAGFNEEELKIATRLVMNTYLECDKRGLAADDWHRAATDAVRASLEARGVIIRKGSKGLAEGDSIIDRDGNIRRVVAQKGSKFLVEDEDSSEPIEVKRSEVKYYFHPQNGETDSPKDLILRKVGAEEIKATAKKLDVGETWLSRYAESMNEKNSDAAVDALEGIKEEYLREHSNEKTAIIRRDGVSSSVADNRLFAPIEKAIKEKYGDVDVLIEEIRKRAEEFSLLSDEDLDKRYMDALDNGDEAMARELLAAAARRKGYGDIYSAYQSEGVWAAPSKWERYKTDEARREAAAIETPDLNIEDMAAGYSYMPMDIFEHPEKYDQKFATSAESGKVIQTAIDEVKSGKKDVKVKVYRAVPTSVKEGKLRNGDWVTPSRKYAEMHGENHLGGKYRIIEDEVSAKELWWDGEDVNEWGYDNGKSYRYKNVENNRKLSDLVTRDDKGEVIPPSKRFNSRKADERYQKAEDAKEASEREKTLRDAVVETMKSAGLDVSMDAEEGQRVLDEVNKHNEEVRLMGSRVEKRMSEIGQYYSDKQLSSEEKAVVNVFGGNKDRMSFKVSTENGTTTIEMRQGNENNAGAKHSIFRHYNTNSGYYTANEVTFIPDIIRTGEREEKGDKATYTKTINGVRYKVVTDIKKGKEVFHDFYTNRTTDTSKSQEHAPKGARTDEASANSAAKVQNNGNIAKENATNIREQRVYHGSGAEFDHFDHSHMGEGEGAQAYGWGTYVTEVEGIGRTYAAVATRNLQVRISGLELDIEKAKERLPFIRGRYKEDLQREIERKQQELEQLRQQHQRHLYTVEIPDDTGENYLSWDRPLTDGQIEKIRKYLADNYRKNKVEDFDASIAEVKNAPNASEVNAWSRRGENIYKTLKSLLGTDKEASKALSEMGFVGIKYPADYLRGGREDGKSNYVIFNEKDAKITDHVRFFRTKDGEAYGYTIGGKIYIDPRIANSETPVHEYAHLWATALRKGNAEEWQNIVGLMKGTKVWDEVKKRYPELKTDDEMADEVLATYSGRRGAERLREEMDNAKGDAKSALQRVKEAIERFWKATADMLHIHYKSAEEVADRVMKDLLDGVDPRKMGNASAYPMEALTKAAEEYKHERSKDGVRYSKTDAKDVKNSRIIPEDVDKSVSSQIEKKFDNTINDISSSAGKEYRNNIQSEVDYVTSLYSNMRRVNVEHKKTYYENEIAKLSRGARRGGADSTNGSSQSEQSDSLSDARTNLAAIERELAYRDARAKTIRDTYGLSRGSKITPDVLERIFKEGNPGKEQTELFQKAFNIAKRLGVDITMESGADTTASGEATISRKINLFLDGLVRTRSPKGSMSRVLLHEMLHQSTMGAINLVKSGKAKGMLTDKQIEAVNTILDLYDKVKNDKERFKEEPYGLQNEYEFAAQMADPRQRKALDLDVWDRIKNAAHELANKGDRSMWQTFKDAVKKLFEVSDKDVMDKALNDIMDNFNETVDDISMNDIEQDGFAYKVTDKDELDRLNKEKTFRMYSGMQELDGKLYSPMAAIIDGKRTDATEIGAWMRSDERPDLVKGGKFTLVKTDKSKGAGEGDVDAAYNPYMHTSTSMMNDQFTGAYARGNIKVVEWDIPESEKTSDYHAEGAKNSVGLVPWHSGSVNGLLPKDRQRSVMLSRWRKAVRVVPDSEVAESIANQLKGTGLAIPWNVVTPNQLRELAKLGVPITTKESGTQSPDVKAKFNAQMEDLKKEFPQAKFVDVKMTKDAHKEWGKNGGTHFRMELGETFSNSKEDFDGVRGRAVEENGIVMPNLNKESVNVVPVENHNFGNDIKESIENANKWAKENLVTSGNDLPTMRDGTPYTISKAAIDKYLSKSATSKSEDLNTHLSVLQKLTDVIHESIEAEIHPDYKKGDDGVRNARNGYGDNILIHRLYGAVELDGKMYRVKTTMQEFRGGEENKPHSYEVTKIELLEGSEKANESDSLPLSSASNNSIEAAKLLNGVEKSYDSGKKLLDESKDLTEGDTYFKDINTNSSIADDAPLVVKHVAKIAKKLGSNVNMVNSPEEVTNKEARERIERGENVTGWYDEKTGEVHLYMPNIHDTYTAAKTVWHETVGHKGMRGLLGEHFKGYMRALWMDLDNPINAELRAYVKERMAREPMSMYDAIEEFIAEMAEKGKGEPGFWNNIKNKVVDALHEVGYRLCPNVKDVKYMLWLAKNVQKHGNDPVWRMRADAVKWKIGREKAEYTSHDGEFRMEDGRKHDFSDMNKEEWNEATDGTIHYRTTPSAATATDRYHRMLSAHGYMAQEAYMDNMLSLDKLMRALDPSIKKIEDVKSWMNPYMLQNTMQGMMSEKMQRFEADVMKPLDKAMARMLDAVDGKNDVDKIRNFNLYMIKKHGLERNRVFFVRDAVENMAEAKRKKTITDFNAERAKLGSQLRSGQLMLSQYYVELDKWIRQNVNANYQAGEHDYSGMHGMYGIDDKKSPYNDIRVQDEVMSVERAMEGMRSGCVDEFWDMVKTATQYSLNEDYVNGFVTKENYDSVSAMFDWYVPLRKFDEETAEDVYGYVTENGEAQTAIGPALLKAKGRKSLSETNILAQIGAMANFAVARGGQNKVKQAFALYVRNVGGQGLVSEAKVWLEKKGVDMNGNDIWEETYPDIEEGDSPDTIAAKVDAFEKKMVALEAKGEAKNLTDQGKSIGLKFERKKDKNQHFVDVMIAGRTYRFVVNGNPRAAQALNGQLENGKATFGRVKAATRFMAQMATSYNPEFVVRNILRDGEFALQNVTAREGGRYAAKWLKYYFFKDMFNGAKSISMKDVLGNSGLGLYAKYRAGKLNTAHNKTEQYFEEFMQNGGETGWVQIKNMDEWTKQYRKDILRERRLTSRAAKALKDLLIGNVENLNEVAENAARFATYCASREIGRDVTRSAYDAKQVSVNFNRHGSGDAVGTFESEGMTSGAKIRRSIYGATAGFFRNYSMFFNAAAQSTHLLFKNVKDAPVATTTALMAAPFLTSIGIAMVNGLLIAQEDEKKRGGVKDPYAELPNYIRRNNICFYIGGGDFVTIPLSMEHRSFYGVGDIVAGLTMAPGLKTQRNVLVDIMGSLSQLFPVVDFTNSEQYDKAPLKETVKGVLPTAVAPFAEWWMNSDWKGAPIRRVSEWNKEQPAWKSAYSSTPERLLDLNKWVNAKTNDVAPGNENMKGNAFLDALTDPSMLNHIIGTLGGGAITTTMRMENAVEKGKDAEWNELPFARNFAYHPTERSAMARTKTKWYNYVDALSTKMANMEALRNKNLPLEERIKNRADLYKFEHSADKLKLDIVKRTQKQLKRWRKLRALNAGNDEQERYADYNMGLIMQDAVERLDALSK